MSPAEGIRSEVSEFLEKYGDRFPDLRDSTDLREIPSDLLRFSDFVCSFRNVRRLKPISGDTMLLEIPTASFRYITCQSRDLFVFHTFDAIKMPRDLNPYEVAAQMKWSQLFQQDKELMPYLSAVGESIELRMLTESMPPVERKGLEFLPKGDWIHIVMGLRAGPAREFRRIIEVKHALRSLERMMEIVKEDFYSTIAEMTVRSKGKAR
ncbi:MAG: hypothetical protein ACE5OY_00810 [Candidatus Bathyarchaeia archaeon]